MEQCLCRIPSPGVARSRITVGAAAITDTVFDVELLATRHRLFVVPEHKSYVDAETPGQMVAYCVHLALSTRTDGEPPALVVPILLCHGKTAWPDTQPPHPHLEGFDPEAAAVLAALQAGVRLLIDDLKRCTEPELRRAGLTALAQLTHLCLRFLREWTPTEALAGIDRWADLLRAVDRDEGPPMGQDAVDKIGWYCLHVTQIPAEELHVTFQRILQRPEETIMSTAEKLKCEGRAGLLLRQLTKRFGPLPAETVARINAAALEDLDRWGERVLDRKTLAEVFAAA